MIRSSHPCRIISTHALTEGDDFSQEYRHWEVISTHALTEGDFLGMGLKQAQAVFQLTPSRRATPADGFPQLIQVISTHALTEGDVQIR